MSAPTERTIGYGTAHLCGTLGAHVLSDCTPAEVAR